VHHFAVTATTAGAVGVQCGVDALVFGLAGLPVNLDVIDLHVEIAGVVIEFNLYIACGITVIGVVLVAGTQRPVGHRGTTDVQVDVFTAIGATGTYDDRGAAAARTRAA